ncbi:helix-turn-helix domain-containing protein [Pseudomonas graminis]|uniref:helix-turn-helix domain-containing protein n=1 Tax=Pseudomonas graminis TaxID=158627 RepID=UPI003C21BB19
MNNPVPTMQEVAADAEFQLIAAADQLNWLAALAGAIQFDHVHGGGRRAAHLAQIAQHLSDTGFCGVRSAIDELQQLSESAPQNPDMPNRGAHGVGNTLAERVASARESAGLTQQTLAAKIKVKQATVSYLESGRTKRSGFLPDIARACGVDIGWLAFGAEGDQ